MNVLKTLPGAICLLWTTILFFPVGARAEVVLAAQGQTDYQIVIPDGSATEAIGDCLLQTARLLQTAFVANGVPAESLPIVAESQRDPQRPAICLGNTALAREHGVDVTQLQGWGYVHRVIEGRDVVIAGHDHPAPAAAEGARRPAWDRLGTVKGVADFLRQYAGTRFLYPDLAWYQSVQAAAQIDLLATPAIEFLPRAVIAVPADLDVLHTPMLSFNTAHPPGGSSTTSSTTPSPCTRISSALAARRGPISRSKAAAARRSAILSCCWRFSTRRPC